MYFLQKSFHVFKLSFIFIMLVSSVVSANPIKKIFGEATLAFGRGDFKRAEKLYLETLKIFPQFAPSYYYLALVSKARGDSLDVSLKYLKKAVEFDPNYSEAYDNIGKIQYSLGEFEKAEKNFLKAINLKPQLISARLSVAWMYLLVQSDFDKAIEQFKAVLKTDEVSSAYFGLGLAYVRNEERIKVLDIITALNFMGEAGLAEQLETMIRERRYIPPKMLAVPVAASKRSQSTIGRDLPALDSEVKNMKIRLREKRLNPIINSSASSNQPSKSGEQRIRDMQNKKVRKGSGY